MCTLFLHHLNDEDAIELLQRMAQAASGACWSMICAELGSAIFTPGPEGGCLRAPTLFTRMALSPYVLRLRSQKPSARVRRWIAKRSISPTLAATISDVMEEGVT